MKIQKLLLFALFLPFFIPHLFAQGLQPQRSQVLKGAQAAAVYPEAEVVRYRSLSPVPNFIKFRETQEVPGGDLVKYVKGVLDLAPAYDLELIRTEYDQLGFMHLRFQQTYEGIPVEGGVYLIHYQMGHGIQSINGEIFPLNNLPTQPTLSGGQALQAAIQAAGAQSYKWEMPAEAALISGYPFEAYYDANGQPQGLLTYMPVDADFEGGNFRLAYKFDIYAHQPMSRTFTYVDALNGQILFQENLIHTIDTMGTAVTAYSGVQSITTDLTGSWYTLKESGRGNGIETLNLQRGIQYSAAIDFFDADNYWNNFNPNKDEVATDAHFGTESTYDYFFQNFGRNSIDGAGFALFSYVHFFSGDPGIDINAFWNGRAMTYGVGSNSINPLISVDITGHEISHGLTRFTANLIYANEPGALNESFSDIFGNAIERFARPGNYDWRLGEDIGFIIRNMANPKQFTQPDTYGGMNWWTSPGDNGGVHYNSGVQNYWFYLLTEGGTGINDNNITYNISGIGLEKAGAIAYRNLTTYLTRTSQYGEAQFYSIQAAGDLFGGCSDEMIQTANAWHAVGVGTLFSQPTVVSNFEALNPVVCSYPTTVRFRNLSEFANEYEWDFGDGTISNAVNPSHSYQTPGTYTITLKVRSDCSTDSIVSTKTNYVTINTPPTAPQGVDGTASCNSSVQVSATGSGQIEWRDAGGKSVGVGNTFLTPVLNTTQTYYAFDRQTGAVNNLGPLNSSIGAGFYLQDPNDQYLTFSVYKPMILQSVWTSSATIRNRTIKIWKADGTPLHTLTKTIGAVQARIDLDVFLEPGDYRIGGSLLDLYSNTRGASYPYSLSGVAEITGSSNPDGRVYHFFYDWQVAEVCISAGTPVVATIEPLPAPAVADVETCGEESVSLVANESGTVSWYDENQNLVYTGSTFQTPVLSSTTRYYVAVENAQPEAFVGKPSFVSGDGGFDVSTHLDYLEFTVEYPFVLESFLVNAGNAGERDILLLDETGAIVEARKINIPFGVTTIPINLTIQPGTYRLGGRLTDLFYNSTGAAYPYKAPGIMEITGSSAGPDYYYFFYNWKIKPLVCISDQKEVTITIGADNPPTASFDLTQDFGSLSLESTSQNATTLTWDFGDGTVKTGASVTHTFAQKGTYSLTLIAQNGACEDFVRQTITVDFIPGDLLFNATLVDRNDVRLDWQVNGALDTEGYEVEYAKEGVFDYEKITFVPYQNPEIYEEFVTELTPGLYHFRIKQIDIDGKFRFSQVEDILVSPPDPGIKVYPSPATSASTSQFVEVQLPTAGEYRVSLYNDLGQVVQTFHAGLLEAGAHVYELNLARYSNGVYYARLQGESLNLIQKVLIIR